MHAQRQRLPPIAAASPVQSDAANDGESAQALGRSRDDHRVGIGGALHARRDVGRDKASATRLLNELRTRQRDEFIAPAYLAAILIGLGRTDEALAALAEAYAQRSWYVSWWTLDPDLDPLRSDPRFTALLKKASFQP